MRADLPSGVELLPLEQHRDDRGWLSEIFRDDRSPPLRPCQWNATVSEPNVLRGMHAHFRHRDYLVVVHGRLSVGLFDIREESATYRSGAIVEVSGDAVSALCVPVGVLHGFYSHAQTIYIYGVDAYFDPSDELGCHWSDPGLNLEWPCTAPVLSPRDRNAGTLHQVEEQFRAAVGLRRATAVSPLA